MPFTISGEHRSYYRLDGADAAPVLVLSHSLGLDHAMWDEQVDDLLPYLRLLRYDTRGHGASSVSAGDYTVAELGRDVLALVDELGVERFAFCGLSLGGIIGQWLAAQIPERLTGVVLANTSPRPDTQTMEQRRRAVIEGGMTLVADTVMGRFFSPSHVSRNPPRVAWARRTLLATNPKGYAGCCAASRDWDGIEALGHIRVPCLVIGGDRDVPMPWAQHGELLAQRIPGARAVLLPAAHLSSLERPRSFSAALAQFLVPDPSSPLEAGFAVRREVLGDAHVDRATATATDFTREFQQLITTYAWGTIWTRPGLDLRTRRLLVLAMTAALGRWEEFRLHIRTGLAQDLEASDIEEVLLQVAIYAGVPAANTGFQIGAEEIAVQKT
jgi:3-oxoadipate enol-lactonase/4-carboxymuconolactone decarboxylase